MRISLRLEFFEWLQFDCIYKIAAKFLNYSWETQTYLLVIKSNAVNTRDYYRDVGNAWECLFQKLKNRIENVFVFFNRADLIVIKIF